MITLYTIKELHHITGRVQAVRQRLEMETAGPHDAAGTTDLKVLLSEASVALYAAIRKAEEVAKAQQGKR